jgi:hypothetical protein
MWSRAGGPSESDPTRWNAVSKRDSNDPSSNKILQHTLSPAKSPKKPHMLRDKLKNEQAQIEDSGKQIINTRHIFG